MLLAGDYTLLGCDFRELNAAKNFGNLKSFNGLGPSWLAMVTHRHRRTILTVLGLYVFATLFIGYFGVNAFTGNHGLRAQQDLEQQLAAMKDELGQLKGERALWERRVSLLRADRIDPDMLDERARALIGYVDPHDLTLLLHSR